MLISILWLSVTPLIGLHTIINHAVVFSSTQVNRQQGQRNKRLHPVTPLFVLIC